MKSLILYGLQRTGTNYLETLLPGNFTNIEMLNDGAARSLPVHKHFRLYEKQDYIPEPKYFNDFSYDTLSDLEAHLTHLTGKENIKFVVTVRNPYNWYLSYCRLARKNTRLFKRNKWKSFMRHSENPHFMIDYSLFYGKWLDFINKNPDKALLICHEDMLKDMENSLNYIADKFNLKKKYNSYADFDKVNMSKIFTDKKRSYYLKNEFLKEFGEKELEILTAHLDEELVNELGYELAK